MTTLRKDFLTGEWVTIAENRNLRPLDSGSEEFRCPFCKENRDLITDPIYHTDRITIIPNLYAAFDTSDNQNYGFHDVLIDTPLHTERLHKFSLQNILEVFWGIKNRLEFYAEDKKIRYVQVFKNQGRKAGASLTHSHWQIVAVSFVPQKQQEIVNNFEKHRMKTGECYLCSQMDQIKAQELIVWEDENIILYVPYASQYKSALQVIPKKHCNGFLNMDSYMLKSLAIALSNGLNALCIIYKELDYNICFQDRVTGHDGHFFLQIIPRLGNIAGFEFGTGCYINSEEPTKSVKKMRMALKTLNEQ